MALFILYLYSYIYLYNYDSIKILNDLSYALAVQQIFQRTNT